MDYEREPMPRWAKVMWIVYLVAVGYVIAKVPLWWALATLFCIGVCGLVAVIGYVNRNTPE